MIKKRQEHLLLQKQQPTKQKMSLGTTPVVNLDDGRKTLSNGSDDFAQNNYSC